MTITLALGGDTMLGRGVADKLVAGRHARLFADPIVEAAREADLFLLNLECCISARGARWPDPRKPFFFRAPPKAVDELVRLGVDCVTLANNHALDYGYDALLDTFRHLDGNGIRWVGAGWDLERARAPVVLEGNDMRVAVFGITDHPAEFEALPDRPGVAFAGLTEGVPTWLVQAIGEVAADVVVLLPHWGPNMNPEPLPYVMSAGETLVESGAQLVAGHSAHVFQGVRLPVIYDLGDLVDDYAVDSRLRNDLGLLFFVTIDGYGPVRLEALPLELDHCYTRPATGDAARWIGDRFGELCGKLGTSVSQEGGRLVVVR